MNDISMMFGWQTKYLGYKIKSKAKLGKIDTYVVIISILFSVTSNVLFILDEDFHICYLFEH